MFVPGNSEDELDGTHTSQSGDEDSLDSPTLLHQSPPTYQSNNPSSPSSRNSPDLPTRTETENLRIRSVDQLLSPETLKLQEQFRVSENGRLPLNSMESRKFFLNILLPGIVPQEIEIRESGDGVWTKTEVRKGAKFGPFLGKLLGEPIDPRFAWKVSSTILCSWIISRNFNDLET